MNSILRSLALAVPAALGACASPTPAPPDDFLAVAAAALPQLERKRQGVRYVVPANIDPRARAALATLRPVLEPAEVPAVPGVSLPDRHVLIHGFKVEGEHAEVYGQGGPVLTGAALACGYLVRIPLQRVQGRWIAQKVPVAMC